VSYVRLRPHRLNAQVCEQVLVVGTSVCVVCAVGSEQRSLAANGE
jgi:hypothetical protein